MRTSAAVTPRISAGYAKQAGRKYIQQRVLSRKYGMKLGIRRPRTQHHRQRTACRRGNAQRGSASGSSRTSVSHVTAAGRYLMACSRRKIVQVIQNKSKPTRALLHLQKIILVKRMEQVSGSKKELSYI